VVQFLQKASQRTGGLCRFFSLTETVFSKSQTWTFACDEQEMKSWLATLGKRMGSGS